MTPFKFAIKTKYTATKRIHRLHASYHFLVFPLFLLGVGNLGSDNSLKWPQISTKKKTDNRQYTLEARYDIFIKNFPVFVPPKPDREYSYTNFIAHSLSLGHLWVFFKRIFHFQRVFSATQYVVRAEISSLNEVFY